MEYNDTLENIIPVLKTKEIKQKYFEVYKK